MIQISRLNAADVVSVECVFCVVFVILVAFHEEIVYHKGEISCFCPNQESLKLEKKIKYGFQFFNYPSP